MNWVPFLLFQILFSFWMRYSMSYLTNSQWSTEKIASTKIWILLFPVLDTIMVNYISCWIKLSYFLKLFQIFHLRYKENMSFLTNMHCSTEKIASTITIQGKDNSISRLGYNWILNEISYLTIFLRLDGMKACLIS